MSQHFLNKYEKEQRIIELHLQNKTIREIAKEIHMSFRDISKIIKAYEREAKREESNQSTQPKKPSISSQAFILFKEGKKIDEAKVLLNIPFNLAVRYWEQYLKSIGMFEAFEFYEDHSYDIPKFLSIHIFMKRNNIPGKDVVNVLREANDVINLKETISNLKAEIEKLIQTKNNYSLNQNTNNYKPLLPLGLPEYYYRY
jgi:transposase